MSYSDILVEPLEAFDIVLSRPAPFGVLAPPGVRRVSSSTNDTGRLSSCGGGRKMTESAPTVGMNPSGGRAIERCDMDGLGARAALRSERISMGSGEWAGARGSGRDDLAEGDRSGYGAEGGRGGGG